MSEDAVALVSIAAGLAVGALASAMGALRIARRRRRTERLVLLAMLREVDRDVTAGLDRFQRQLSALAGRGPDPRGG